MEKSMGLAACLCAAVLWLAGCGTLKHGTSQELTIQSSPPGALVIVDGKDEGETPVSVKLSRKTRHTISVSMYGYQTYQTMIRRKLSGWSVLGGPVGLLIDDATGGMYKLSPSELRIQLMQDSVLVVTD